MRLNSRGQAAMGVGDGYISIDGRVIANGGAVDWVTDDVIIFQNHGAGDVWRVYLYNQQSNEYTEAAPRGANRVAGGGGRWAAWVDGYGMWTSDHLVLPESWLETVGPNGAICYKNVYQSDGPWTVREPDGSEWRLSDTPVLDVQLLGPKAAIYRVGTEIRAAWLPAPKQLDGAKSRPRALMIGGVWWICYFSDLANGLVLHPFDSLVGYGPGDGAGELQRGPVAFNHDVVCLTNTSQAIVGWSITLGEYPEHLRKITVDVNTRPRVDLSVYNPPINIPPPSLPALPRKMWIAPFFSYSERYGDTPLDQLAGNAVTIVEEPGIDGAVGRVQARVRALGQPMVVQGTSRRDDAYTDLTVAWWVGRSEDVPTALSLPEKPVIAYLDVQTAQEWPASRPDWATNRVWPSVQAYRRSDEALDAFQGRVSAMLDRVSGYGRPIVLVPRFDDLNGTSTVQRTLECMPLYDRWVRDYFIVGLMPFADRRGNGIARNQALHDWAMAFVQANPTRPNRYDYWLPSGTDIITVLRNKLMQTTEMIALSPDEKQFIMDRLGGSPPPPDDDATPGLTDAQFATLVALRAEYPEFHEEFPDGDPRRNALTGAQMGALLNKVCWIHRNDSNKPGLQKKPGNATHTVQPHTGIEIWNGMRFLVKGHHYGQDVLASASIGKATPYRATPGDADMVKDLRVEPVEP